MGVTGLVDISPAAPAFTARIYKFSRQTSSGPIVRTKRGDAWKRIRQTTPGGTLALSGKVQQAGFPLPDNIKGASGTIVLQFNGAAKETLSVTVLAASLSLSETAEDIWDIALTCEITANPVLSGFTGAQTASVPNPSFDAGEVIEGISKSVDPDGLADQDARPYDLEGLTDSDAAEVTAITNIIGATVATRAAMKLRNVAFQRTDHWGGTVLVTFARTTTAEDVINQNSRTGIDPKGLASSAATAAINGTPADPVGDAFVLRSTTTNELNDNHLLSVNVYGKTSTQTDIEYAGTIKADDPSDLQDEASLTEVTASSTPPATPLAPLGQIDQITSQQLTDDGHWKHTFTYRNTNSQQKVEFAGTATDDDPSDLQDEDRATIVNGSSTPPATPTPTPSTLKLRRRISRRIGGTPEKWSHSFEFGRRSTQDDVEMEGTETRIDSFQLSAGGRITLVTASATPPATPASPTAGAVFVDNLVRPLHDSKWAHTFLYGPRTTADEAILPHTWTLADPGDLDSEGEVAAIGSVPATPSPYYDRGVTGHYLTSGQILYVKKFGRRSTTQDIEMEHTTSTGDPWEGLVTHNATVISDVSAVDVIAASNYSTLANFAGVSVKRLNDAKALLIKSIRDDPRIINFEMRSPGEEPVRGYYDGTDVYVYVRRIYQRANGWEFELAMQPLQTLRMRFSIRKRVTGASIATYMGWSLTGHVNNASFLGLAAGSVTYRGIDGQHNYSNAGPAEIANQCEYLAIAKDGTVYAGHINFKKANLGWHFSTHDLSAVSPGTWVKATTLYEGASAFDSAALPTADFSGLLT